MNFDKFQGNGQTSIKCHHPPGGNSSFSLGWNGENTPTKRTMSRQLSKSRLNIITNELNPENQENMTNSQLNINVITEFLEPMTKSQKFANTPRSKLNLFGNYENAERTNSIKVSNAPGGRSNVLLGSDNTSYNDYRRK